MPSTWESGSGAGQAICYEELGIYRLLLQVGDMQELWQFVQDVLGPLTHYDARHKVDLVGPLSAYLNQHEGLKQTARSCGSTSKRSPTGSSASNG